MAQQQSNPVDDAAARDAAQERAKMKRQIQRLLRHTAATEQALAQLQTKSQQSEAAHNQKVGDLQKVVDITRNNLVQMFQKQREWEEDLKQARAETEKAMKNEVKYKKKVSALFCLCILVSSSFVCVCSTTVLCSQTGTRPHQEIVESSCVYGRC